MGVLWLGLDPSPELRCRRSSRLGDGDDDLGLEQTSKGVSEMRTDQHGLSEAKKGRRKPYLHRNKR